MKPRCLLAPFLLFLAVAAAAQERIYRCGNEYTNNASTVKARNCKLLEGSNVTVIQGTRVAPGAGSGKAAAAPSAATASQRVEPSEQRARDQEARGILEAELRRAEARQAELKAEYNNGEPERRGDEARNYQKYLDRTAELKASLGRTESDIASIKRELGRVPSQK